MFPDHIRISSCPLEQEEQRKHLSGFCLLSSFVNVETLPDMDAVLSARLSSAVHRFFFSDWRGYCVLQRCLCALDLTRISSIFFYKHQEKKVFIRQESRDTI